MRYGLILAAFFAVTPAANAAIQSISTTTLGTSSGIKYIYGEIKDSYCASLPCTRTQTVNVGSGYTSHAVFLSNFFLGFKDAAGGAVNHARLVLNAGNYNSGAGTLDITLDANLTANPAPSVVEWHFDVFMMIVVSDDVSTHVEQFDANAFSGNGPNGECDTTGSCFDVTSLAAGRSGIPFRRMFLRGFDVSTVSGNGISLSDLALNVSAYGPAGSNANGSAECYLGSSGATEDIDCKIYEASVASASAASFSYVHKTASVSAQTNWVTGSVTAASATPADASGAAYGLQKLIATPSAAGQLYHLHGGCNPASFNPFAGATGELAMTTNFGLLIPSTTYNSSLQCTAVFLP